LGAKFNKPHQICQYFPRQPNLGIDRHFVRRFHHADTECSQSVRQVIAIQMKEASPDSSSPRTGGLLQSGIIFAGINFLALLVHWIFQFIVSPQLSDAKGEYGLFLATIAFVGFLGLPLPIAIQAVTHYIARFHYSGDDSRLHGLLSGCRKFLFHVTLAGSVVAIILIIPLRDFFNIPRATLTFVALICVLANLWSSFAIALCQGLGWFKRLALIGLLSAVVRVLFGWPATRIWSNAEMAVLASVAMLLPYLLLLLWRKELPPKTETIVSPWTSEFVQFVIVSAACVIGFNCFTQGDLLVAKKYFSDTQMDAYGSAGLFARALPTAVAPLLIVLFSHRSRRHHHDSELPEQLKLIGLHAAVLILGALCLYTLRGICLQLLHRNTPTAVAMIGPLCVTMVFAGLLQALAWWSLASRWLKISLLYGALGLAYWLILLFFGKSPAELLNLMPWTAGISFAAVFLFWLFAMRLHKIAMVEQG
jgi:hypothetical protein